MANDSVSCRSGEAIYAGKFNVAAFWASLAAGWTDITPAGTRPPFGILAFSGTAFDSFAGKLYIIGGGHADYGGNEVWEYDLEARTGFVKHYEPDFTAIYGMAGDPADKYAALAPYIDNVNYPGAVMSGGQPVRPISRHTYASLVWMPHLQKMTIGGGSTYSGMTPVVYWGNVWPNAPADLWFYDPAAKTFEYKGSQLLDSNYAILSRFALHEARRKMYGVSLNGSNRPLVHEYDIAGNTWTVHAAVGPSLNATGVRAVIDSKRDRLVVLVKPSASTYLAAWEYSLSAGTWAEISTTGTPPTNLNSEACPIYATRTDTVLLIRAYTDGIAKLNLATGVWSNEAISGPVFGQASGNWFYDRRRGVALLTYQNLGNGIRVWVYKEPNQ